MRTEQEIKNKREFLNSLIYNTEFSEEIIMSGIQKANIRTKINMLNWVLNQEELKLTKRKI